MHFFNIRIAGYRQWFYRKPPFFCHDKQFDATDYPVLKDYTPSLVIKIPEKKAILKLIRARRGIEYIKMLWGRSRASKEINGNYRLRSIGVAVPAIYEHGMGFLPARHYQFIGYYFMEDLAEQGLVNSRELFLQQTIAEHLRLVFLQNIVNDVRAMQRHRIVFNDFKLENIFCDPQGNSVWIDTGVTHYSALQKRKMQKKYRYSINRFIEHHHAMLSYDECELIRSLY